MSAASKDRVLARSVPATDESGCLRWTGAHTQKGYGHIVVDGKSRPVHVVAHELFIGPVPEGFEVDHVHARGCRWRDCVEPEHLEAVSHAENVRRAVELITECPQGHPYDDENTRWKRNGRGYLGRVCRECGRQGNRRRREMARAS